MQIATCACTSQLLKSPQNSLLHQEHRTSKQPKLRSRRHHRPHFSRRPPRASTVQSYPARPEDLLVLGSRFPRLTLWAWWSRFLFATYQNQAGNRHQYGQVPHRISHLSQPRPSSTVLQGASTNAADGTPLQSRINVRECGRCALSFLHSWQGFPKLPEARRLWHTGLGGPATPPGPLV